MKSIRQRMGAWNYCATVVLHQLDQTWPVLAELYTRAMVMTEDIRLETLKRVAAELHDPARRDRLTLVGRGSQLTVASWIGKDVRRGLQ